MTNKQQELDKIEQRIKEVASDKDFVKMVVELDNLGMARTLNVDSILNELLSNILAIRIEDKFTQPVYELLETYENVLLYWKDTISVQQLIDELMKVENKDVPVRFFNDGDEYIVRGERAFITCVDAMSDTVDLNGQTD
ncbi:hypothetical protein cd3_095 [Carnobacterium phage cd3]|uniref:Uncharacterized protein n=2 Tax=Carnodivirus TaxID=3044682 RepID=A0AAE7VHP9_9CAUD|nr:hypothetical protein PQD68_gp095 [Carnobacterium phage cd2]YP_010676560.1 hypothetical protein PQD69_gp094 [Carnobacterium phage cd4]QXP45221.1 hypothetical protein cd2_095 [Carnobacterium phage cd2]QXP45224.1 hypothetical protein cd3_095 [Carnobacterium phage cd3]QXP45416.1 hypothetical protein cd4_094 [Carnobacterium phage cd4]